MNDFFGSISHSLVIEHNNYAGGWDVWCDDCHNPDGEGIGRCDATVASIADAIDWFADHVIETLDEEFYERMLGND